MTQSNKNNSQEINEINFKKIVLNNFIIFYLLAGFFTFLYGGYQAGIGFPAVIVYYATPFIILFINKYKDKYSSKIILYSALINFLFASIAWGIIIDLNMKYAFYESLFYNSYNIYSIWFYFIGMILFFYVFRFRISNIIKKTLIKGKSFSKSAFLFSKKYAFNFTLIPFFAEKITLRRLSGNYRAVYFAKKFIIIQAKPIKAVLPGALPSTIVASMKEVFQNDIDRLHQLFKYNHITTYSNTAILKFVMNTADPIIKDLQITIEQHLTEELLKEDNNSKNLNIDVDVLWKKIEKIMTNWQSTFSESDFEYRDNLLIK